jgi:PIN domain nuclease of toxin-antitoxin system
MVILDTCALIELCLAEPGIAPKVLAEVERGAHVLSVSFAEIALKVKLKKLSVGRTPEQLAEAWGAIASVTIVPIGVPEWFAAVNLRWSHRDPADRLIVAYAHSKGAAIVTSDREMKRIYRRCIW